MARSAEFSVTGAAEGDTVVLSGDWTANNLGDIPAGLAQELEGRPNRKIDVTRVHRLDTAGAYALIRAAGPEIPHRCRLPGPGGNRCRR